MKPTNNPSRNPINMKVFKNGSLQMTGCKDMEDFFNVTNNLIKILIKGRKIDGKRIRFVNQKELFIRSVKIRMINSNFRLNYKIDRDNLATNLRKYHGKNPIDTEIGYVDYKYDPNGDHSCVNIKFNYEDNITSIFVFQTGAVIITGAKNLHHIVMAYKFIKKILKKILS